ncbi:lysophospholipid acyltransferase family protein [Nocardioides terrisoli]|uniref:lysophospholipid acyltransferase family protein n=1 Tax=Nocardioides terrisoli TaxID=3388267 RepID=UPI00287B603F|nr:lysophospholipid acyltransferase family protein [Nocardioides marmorisolisilvae]
MSTRRMSNEQAHDIARKGPGRVAYFFVRIVLMPVLRMLFAMRVSGKEHVPARGPVVIAPNHKSFWDAFFISAVLSRRIYFMGKAELFEGRAGKLLISLGGFPVRRGASDSEAIATALAILERGDALALFPEGTRVSDPAELGQPRRGAARIAIEGGAPIVPTAITGTEKRRFHLPRRVQVSFAAPIPVAELRATPEDAGKLIEDAVWPVVSEDYRRLRARPGLVAAGLAAVGVGIAVRRWRARR